MNWVKTLVIDEPFSLEKRVASILQYVFKEIPGAKCLMSDVDATGKLGQTLTMMLNRIDVLPVSPSDLLSLFHEDGQVFDMHLEISGSHKIIIDVRRGDIVDILGENSFVVPGSVLGKYDDNDIAHFYP